VEHVFRVVEQLNRGVGLLEDPSERDEVRPLNVLAGRRAKNAVAYVPARTYLTEAAALLPPDAWRARYEEAFDLEIERSECEYLAGSFEVAEELTLRILAKRRSDIDRAKVTSCASG
jgi:predicted ATPase